MWWPSASDGHHIADLVPVADVDTARGTFDVTLQPGAAELDGAVGRFEPAKTFHGDIRATGSGIMLSAGDPGDGTHRYELHYDL